MSGIVSCSSVVFDNCFRDCVGSNIQENLRQHRAGITVGVMRLSWRIISARFRTSAMKRAWLV